MENREDRWIVLIQKRPSGPFTTEEVQALFSQNSIRTNDIAFKFREGDPKNNSGWKLLWQFPEFDRREEFKTTTNAPPQIPQLHDRRVPTSETTAQERVRSVLPEDLAAITPEDLIVSTRKSGVFYEQEASIPVQDTETGILSTSDGRKPVFPPWLGLGFVFVVVGLFFWMRSGSQKVVKPSVPLFEPQDVTSPDTSPPPATILTSKPKPQAPAIPPPSSTKTVEPLHGVSDSGQIPAPWARDRDKEIVEGKEDLDRNDELSEDDLSEIVKMMKDKKEKKKRSPAKSEDEEDESDTTNTQGEE